MRPPADRQPHGQQPGDRKRVKTSPRPFVHADHLNPLGGAWPRSTDQCVTGRGPGGAHIVTARYDGWRARAVHKSPAGAGGAPTAPPGASVTLKTATIGEVTTLTNANGLALYWFAPIPRTSKCAGPCAAYWPPVTGDAKGRAGRHGAARHHQRARPRPGQAHGNNPNLNGGLWCEIPGVWVTRWVRDEAGTPGSGCSRAEGGLPV